jgi:hypothetical protein
MMIVLIKMEVCGQFSLTRCCFKSQIYLIIYNIICAIGASSADHIVDGDGILGLEDQECSFL